MDTMTKLETIDAMIEMMPEGFKRSKSILIISPDIHNGLCNETKRLVKSRKGVKIICDRILPKEYATLTEKYNRNK